MSDYKKKMDIEDALKTMDYMLKVRKIDTRSKSAAVIETVLHEFYKQREKLDQIHQAMYISGCDYETRCEEVWKIFENRETDHE